MGLAEVFELGKEWIAVWRVIEQGTDVGANHADGVNLGLGCTLGFHDQVFVVLDAVVGQERIEVGVGRFDLRGEVKRRFVLPLVDGYVVVVHEQHHRFPGQHKLVQLIESHVRKRFSRSINDERGQCSVDGFVRIHFDHLIALGEKESTNHFIELIQLAF